jgi:ribosomal protein S10
MHFAKTLTQKPVDTANTRLDFVTLRIFPFRKTTGAFLHELRALPPKKMRLANIELPKSEAWTKRQREKGIFKRMYEVISEPRFKFYVKEGRTYTMKTGVPGVWEEVAKRIQEQTANESRSMEVQGKSGLRRPMVRKPLPLVATQERIKRQTSRQPK